MKFLNETAVTKGKNNGSKKESWKTGETNPDTSGESNPNAYSETNGNAWARPRLH